MPKGEWGSEYRNHYRGIDGDYIGTITRIRFPTLPQAPVSLGVFLGSVLFEGPSGIWTPSMMVNLVVHVYYSLNSLKGGLYRGLYRGLL